MDNNQDIMLWLQTTIVGINASNYEINKRILELAEREKDHFNKFQEKISKCETYLGEIAEIVSQIINEKK